MSKEETVEVTLKLPKRVVDFIRDVEGKVEEYLVQCIVDLHVSYVECLASDTKEYPEKIMDQYGLRPVFKSYGVLPCYYRDP